MNSVVISSSDDEEIVFTVPSGVKKESTEKKEVDDDDGDIVFCGIFPKDQRGNKPKQAVKPVIAPRLENVTVQKVTKSPPKPLDDDDDVLFLCEVPTAAVKPLPQQSSGVNSGNNTQLSEPSHALGITISGGLHTANNVTINIQPPSLPKKRAQLTYMGLNHRKSEGTSLMQTSFEKRQNFARKSTRPVLSPKPCNDSTSPVLSPASATLTRTKKNTSNEKIQEVSSDPVCSEGKDKLDQSPRISISDDSSDANAQSDNEDNVQNTSAGASKESSVKENKESVPETNKSAKKPVHHPVSSARQEAQSSDEEESQESLKGSSDSSEDEAISKVNSTAANLFVKFLAVCKTRESGVYMDKAKARLEKHFDSADPVFLNSVTFYNKLKNCVNSVRRSNKLNAFQEMKVILDELKAHPKTDAKILKLEKLLEKLEKKIIALSEREVSSDDDENNSYMQLARFEERAVKVYAKICELSNIPPIADRPYKRNVIFNCDLPQDLVNTSSLKQVADLSSRALEKYYNKTRKFPDFSDVKKLLEKISKENKTTLGPVRLHNMAEAIFIQFGRMLQKLRILDDYNCTAEYLPEGSFDPAATDENLLNTLKMNKRKAKKESEVLAKFALMQDSYKEKGPGKNSSDESSSNVDEDDILEDENDANLPDKNKLKDEDNGNSGSETLQASHSPANKSKSKKSKKDNKDDDSDSENLQSSTRSGKGKSAKSVKNKCDESSDSEQASNCPEKSKSKKSSEDDGTENELASNRQGKSRSKKPVKDNNGSDTESSHDSYRCEKIKSTKSTCNNDGSDSVSVLSSCSGRRRSKTVKNNDDDGSDSESVCASKYPEKSKSTKTFEDESNSDRESLLASNHPGKRKMKKSLADDNDGGSEGDQASNHPGKRKSKKSLANDNDGGSESEHASNRQEKSKSTIAVKDHSQGKGKSTKPVNDDVYSDNESLQVSHLPGETKSKKSLNGDNDINHQEEDKCTKPEKDDKDTSECVQASKRLGKIKSLEDNGGKASESILAQNQETEKCTKTAMDDDISDCENLQSSNPLRKRKHTKSLEEDDSGDVQASKRETKHKSTTSEEDDVNGSKSFNVSNPQRDNDDDSDIKHFSDLDLQGKSKSIKSVEDKNDEYSDSESVLASNSQGNSKPTKYVESVGSDSIQDSSPLGKIVSVESVKDDNEYSFKCQQSNRNKGSDSGVEQSLHDSSDVQPCKENCNLPSKSFPENIKEPKSSHEVAEVSALEKQNELPVSSRKDILNEVSAEIIAIKEILNEKENMNNSDLPAANIGKPPCAEVEVKPPTQVGKKPSSQVEDSREGHNSESQATCMDTCEITADPQTEKADGREILDNSENGSSKDESSPIISKTNTESLKYLSGGSINEKMKSAPTNSVPKNITTNIASVESNEMIKEKITPLDKSINIREGSLEKELAFKTVNEKEKNTLLENPTENSNISGLISHNVAKSVISAQAVSVEKNSKPQLNKPVSPNKVDGGFSDKSSKDEGRKSQNKSTEKQDKEYYVKKFDRSPTRDKTDYKSSSKRRRSNRSSSNSSGERPYTSKTDKKMIDSYSPGRKYLKERRNSRESSKVFKSLEHSKSTDSRKDKSISKVSSHKKKRHSRSRSWNSLERSVERHKSSSSSSKKSHRSDTYDQRTPSRGRDDTSKSSSSSLEKAKLKIIYDPEEYRKESSKGCRKKINESRSSSGSPSRPRSSDYRYSRKDEHYSERKLKKRSASSCSSDRSLSYHKHRSRSKDKYRHSCTKKKEKRCPRGSYSRSRS